MKTLTDTTVTRDADGAVLVRLPSGRGYRRRADPVLDDPADPPY